MCLVLSGKVKVLWKLVLQNDEFLDAFYRLELLNSVTDEVIIYRNSCVHFMVTKMKPLRLKIFQMKGISDFALLPPGKNNLKLYISRAKYVANMYVNTIRLHMCLDDPIYHEWKQDDTVQWRDNCFPENITDVLETCDGKDNDCVSEFKFTEEESRDTNDSERKAVLL